jgi:hypothetical protein
VISRPRFASTAALLALASLLVPGLVSAKPSPEGEPATVERTLNADPKDVFEALKGTLAEWKMRKVSFDDRIVKTSWVYSERLREKFRERVVAEFRKDGYVTHLSVTHEKQRQAKEVRQTVTAGSAPWANWNGNWELARDVIRSVEQALGLEAPAVDIDNLTGRAPAPAGIVRQREYVVPPGVAPRVNDLKARRKSLVAEVRAIDGKILSAVYDGRYEEIKDEVARLKERKAKLEGQVALIDREILQLVLSDGDEDPGA